MDRHGRIPDQPEGGRGLRRLQLQGDIADRAWWQPVDQPGGEIDAGQRMVQADRCGQRGCDLAADRAGARILQAQDNQSVIGNELQLGGQGRFGPAYRTVQAIGEEGLPADHQIGAQRDRLLQHFAGRLWRHDDAGQRHVGISGAKPVDQRAWSPIGPARDRRIAPRRGVDPEVLVRLWAEARRDPVVELVAGHSGGPHAGLV